MKKDIQQNCEQDNNGQKHEDQIIELDCEQRLQQDIEWILESENKVWISIIYKIFKY